MINVTKRYLPPFEEYTAILKWAWGKAWFTNIGAFMQELETMFKDYIDVSNFFFTANGTIVLQMALKKLNINNVAVRAGVVVTKNVDDSLTVVGILSKAIVN